MNDKSQRIFYSSRIVPAIMTILLVIALVYAWTGHKINVGGFFLFLISGAYISHTLPQLIKAKKTGKLGNRLFTIYRDKQPVGFYFSLCSSVLGNLVFGYIGIWGYLSIFGLVIGPK